MSIKDLVKLNGDNATNLPARRDEESYPQSLHREMTQWMSQWDRMFDSLFGRAFGLTPSEGQDWGLGSRWRGFNPAINVAENERELRVTAELPGIDPNDIEMSVSRGSLTITGEKKEESEDKGNGYHRMERSYGTFRRVLSLQDDVDTDKIDAQFKNGVLTLVVPKLPEEKTGKKRIAIKSDDGRQTTDGGRQ
jgi:HSP20 family protein